MRLIFGLLVCLVACGQTSNVVTARFGGLYCGAVRRAVDQVQTYCYSQAGPGKPYDTLVWNAIGTVKDGKGTIVSVVYDTDSIVWQFNLKSSAMTYQYVWDAATIHSGFWIN